MVEAVGWWRRLVAGGIGLHQRGIGHHGARRESEKKKRGEDLLISHAKSGTKSAPPNLSVEYLCHVTDCIDDRKCYQNNQGL